MVISLSVTRNTSGRPGKQVGASSRIGSSQDEDLLSLHRGGQAWSQAGAEDGPEAEQGALEPALLLLLLQLCSEGKFPASAGALLHLDHHSQIAVLETGSSINGSMAWVKVRRWPTLAPVNNKVTALCVKPLHNSFNRAVWLVEFIEMYQILGVSHFVLYNHSVRKSLNMV